MTADEVLEEVLLTRDELSFIYKKVVLLFERASTDDDAYSLYDNRIANYCRVSEIEIVPKRTIADVCFYLKRNQKVLLRDRSGILVFAHNSRNQLRQLIHHVRNACAHAGVRIVNRGDCEYIEIMAAGGGNESTKLFGLLPRENFVEFWSLILETLHFN